MNPQLVSSLVESLGWTLVHFVWQGALVAALLAAGLRLLRNVSANQRYLLGCGALLLLIIAPVITLERLGQKFRPLDLPVAQVAIVRNSAPAASAQSSVAATATAWLNPTVRKLSLTQRVEKFLPVLVAAWTIGVFALTLRLFAGWWQIKRFRRVAIAAVEEIWRRKLAELAERLQVNRPIKLLQSALVEVPTVIGWLRPVILLPASCVAGLSAAQLEAILAHELAHIRRHDYLVNLLQSAVETLLFYHPAVWWISRQVREERENCCDDVAVTICGDRITYARALATLEEMRQAPGQLALAASGAPLLQRIRRLAGHSSRTTQRPAWPLAGMIVLVFLVAAIGLRGVHVVAGNNENVSTNEPPHSSAIQKPVLAKTDDAPVSNTSPVDAVNVVPVNGNATFSVQATGTAPLSYQWHFNNPSNLSVTTNVQTTKPERHIHETNPGQINKITGQLNGNGEPALSTRTFHVDTNLFHAISKSPLTPLVPNSDGANTNAAKTDLSESQAAVRRFLSGIGVDLGSDNPANVGKMFIYNPRKGTLTVRASDEDLDRIEVGLGQLNPTPPQINLKVKFIEIKNSTADWPMSAVDSSTERAIGPITGILTAAQLHAAINTLERRDDVGELNAPEITTESGRQAQIQTQAAGVAINGPASTLPTGPVLDVVPFVSADGFSVQMTLMPTLPGSPSGNSQSSHPPVSTSVTVWDTQSVVLGGLKYVTSSGNTNTLLVFVTPTIINPDGTRAHSDAQLQAVMADPRLAAQQGVQQNISQNQANLDKPGNSAKIDIKLKIAEIDEAESHETGFSWLFPSVTNLAAAPAALQEHSRLSKVFFDPARPVTNSIISQFTDVLGANEYRNKLARLTQSWGVDVLSAPEVLTRDGLQAQIQVVDVQTIVTGLTSTPDAKGKLNYNYHTENVELGPTVDVVPKLSADGKSIELNMVATVTEFLGYEDPHGKIVSTAAMAGDVSAVTPLPQFRARQLSTRATVANGGTIVLGGIAAQSVIIFKDKVPVLGSVPLLGRLFQTTIVTKTRKNLLVFATPTIEK